MNDRAFAISFFEQDSTEPLWDTIILVYVLEGFRAFILETSL